MLYLKYFMLFWQLRKYVPMIVEFIQQAEAAIGPGKGSEKLELVRTRLEKADVLLGKFEGLWPTVKQFIDLFVALKLK